MQADVWYRQHKYNENVLFLFSLGKVIVHEFAHLIWGVFEEYPRPGTSDKQYYIDKNGNKTPNTCSSSINGTWVLKNNTDESCADNKTDPKCFFKPGTAPVDSASVMGYMSVENVCIHSFFHIRESNIFRNIDLKFILYYSSLRSWATPHIL